jgi:hypothetical protein
MVVGVDGSANCHASHVSGHGGCVVRADGSLGLADGHAYLFAGGVNGRVGGCSSPLYYSSYRSYLALSRASTVFFLLTSYNLTFIAHNQYTQRADV